MITKQKVLVLIASVSLIVGLSFAFSASVVAQSPGGVEDGGSSENKPEEDEPDCQPGEKGCCGGVKTSIIGGEVCGDSGEGNVIFNLLVWVLRIMTAGVGVAAVGGIGYGALLYTTAEGKPDQTKKAIGIISNVVIGIGAYALMALLLNFLIPGGVFR